MRPSQAEASGASNENTHCHPRPAGFGGLELSTLLSENLGEAVDITLIDKADAFMFGFSKLDVMFGHKTADAEWMPYRNYAKPGVRLLKETITAIDPNTRRVTTNTGVHEADILVVALGAEYDFDATPGLADTNEFYSIPGALRLGEVLPSFTKGKAIVGVCGAPYKCPPAPSECALMLHDYLVQRGVREACDISFVLPLSSPVPPSPETSRALIAAFAERDINFIPGQRVARSRQCPQGRRAGRRRRASLRPLLRRPQTPRPRRGAGERHGRRRLDPRQSAHPGDQLSQRLCRRRRRQYRHAQGRHLCPRARRAPVASAIIAQVRARPARPDQYDGAGTCYIEFGAGRIGKVEVDFFSRPLAYRNLLRTVAGTARRQERVRRLPPRPLVRDVIEVT